MKCGVPYEDIKAGVNGDGGGVWYLLYGRTLYGGNNYFWKLRKCDAITCFQ